ncbi:MAG TPA: LytTR family DNA-binding domain-containing protein [Burkholderiaceae bacterium]|nr:LytTR family DNA-binding domain-containing protein [Burkholderiaceae bacterium]
MKAIIADDEPHLAQYLRDKLARLWPELQIVAMVDSGPAAAAAIAECAPDIAFLDIRMPGATGLQVAEQLAPNTTVVFVTAYDQYAVDAFERDAVDYLLKPVTDERLSHTVEKLKAGVPSRSLAPLLQQLSEHLASGSTTRHLRWIRASKRSAEGDITQQIPVADVQYFQADDKYTCVFARDGAELTEWLIRVPLSELGEQLNPDDFAQIHRSVIVNLNAVAATRRDLGGKLYVRMRDTARELPVSRQYVHLFRQM